jgi:hypothetical protein
MREAEAVGKLAIRDITRWLKRDADTRKVVNVEAEPEYQAKDIDLLWHTRASLVTIEVKADRHDQTGNFFFETVSNKAAGTPGCFLYTEADFVYYYFVGPKKLYILPMPATRDWFAANLKNFKEVATTTPVRGGSYTTVGRLVKIERVLNAVSGVRVMDVAAELSKPHPWPASAFARLLAGLKFWR